jgi:hypothetical protein
VEPFPTTAVFFPFRRGEVFTAEEYQSHYESTTIVPRRLFLLHSRKEPSPEGTNNINKSAVPRGKNIRKKKGEKSSNFGEILKKLYFLVCWKARQRASHANPQPSARYQTFYTWKALQVRSAVGIATRTIYSWGRVGEGRVICETMPFVNRSSDQLQIQNQDSQYYFAP